MLDRFPVRAVLPASDVQRAKAWYAEKLGLSPKVEDPGGLWYECAEGTWFFVTPSQFAGTAQNTAASWTVTEIESVMAELRAGGVVFEDYDLPGFKTVDGLYTYGPYKAAWFKDSEGSIFEISEVPSRS